MRDKGFTLIELLIVVAIISILSAIAVPNFLEAQTRAKVSRVKADMRSMATALEAYMVDTNHYPLRHDQWERMGGERNTAYHHPPFREKVYDPDAGEEHAAVGLHTITTPIPYISSLPRDVFNTPATGAISMGPGYSDVIDYYDPFQLDKLVAQFLGVTYREGLARGYALISVGPDQYLGVMPGGSGYLDSRPGNYPTDSLYTKNTDRWIYDPTNGTVSTGNIYRFSGDLTQKDLRREY